MCVVHDLITQTLRHGLVPFFNDSCVEATAVVLSFYLSSDNVECLRQSQHPRTKKGIQHATISYTPSRCYTNQRVDTDGACSAAGVPLFFSPRLVHVIL